MVVDTMFLTSATAPGDSTIVVSSAIEPNDRYILEGEADEIIKIKSYDSSTMTATLYKPLFHEHDSGEVGIALFGTASINTTDTDTFVLGTKIVTTFYPIGSADSSAQNYPVTSYGEILNAKLNTTSLEDDFSILYPNEYRILNDGTFQDYYEICKRRVQNQFRLSNINLDKVMNNELINDFIIDYMRYQLLLTGGEKLQEELIEAKEHLDKVESRLLGSLIWQDEDQDNIKEEGEEDRHLPQTFARGL
jgi:hypothetical protein